MNNQPNNNIPSRNAAGTTGGPGVRAVGAAQPAVKMNTQPRVSANNSAAVAGIHGTEGPGGSMRSGGGGSAPGGNGGGKRTILIVLGCVVAAVAVWVLIWLFACNGSGLFDPNAQTGQAPYKSEAEMQAELDRVVEEGMFNISIASTIQFADGTSSGTAYIENVPGNRYNMQVSITEDATGDLLYESGVLSPNQYIESITLAKDLEAGSYDATATFTALDPTTYDEVGQAAAKVNISVLN